jgi:DNA-binding response OmpR family regulator
MRTACFDAGADDVFVKPIPASVLRRRLTEAALVLRTAVVARERSA